MCQRKMFKSVRRKLNTLMDNFGKNMNGIWILNMSITNQQTKRIAPEEIISGLMTLRKKTEKVEKLVKLKWKNLFQRETKYRRQNYHRKSPQSKKPRKSKRNQHSVIICQRVSYENKENILKNCRKNERQQHNV